jgi:hypothetical protein
LKEKIEKLKEQMRRLEIIKLDIAGRHRAGIGVRQ